MPDIEIKTLDLGSTETGNDLVRVAEGILDSAYDEYRAETLGSLTAIDNYASACGVDIDDEQARTIQRACLEWVQQGSKDQNAYNQTVTASHQHSMTEEEPFWKR